jgi:hypothetical protein
MTKTAKKTAALARRQPKTAPSARRAELVPKPNELADAAAAYAGASRAENNKRAYTNDFIMFTTWCAPQGFATMPALPSTVALYLTALATSDRKVATIERALVAMRPTSYTGFPPRGRRPR